LIGVAPEQMTGVVPVTPVVVMRPGAAAALFVLLDPQPTSAIDESIVVRPKTQNV
jgi:hypothetical protein